MPRDSGVIVFLSLHREASVLGKPESPHLPAASTLNQPLVFRGWSISCFAVLLEQQFQPFPTEAAEGIEGFFWLTLADYRPSCWGNAGGRGSRQMAMLCWEQWVPTCRIFTVPARTPAHGVCCPQLRWASMPLPNLGNPTGNPRGMSCSWFCQDDNILYIYICQDDNNHQKVWRTGCSSSPWPTWFREMKYQADIAAKAL